MRCIKNTSMSFREQDNEMQCLVRVKRFILISFYISCMYVFCISFVCLLFVINLYIKIILIQSCKSVKIMLFSRPFSKCHPPPRFRCAWALLGVARTLTLGDFDAREASAARLTDGRAATVHDRMEHLAHAADADSEVPHSGCVDPHMHERDEREVAAPENRQPYSGRACEQVVTKSLVTLEAFVSEFPHATDGVGPFRFRKNVFEADLWITAMLSTCKDNRA